LSSRRNPFPRGGVADVATVVRYGHPIHPVQCRRPVHDDCPAALVLASLFSHPPPTGSIWSIRGRTIQPLGPTTGRVSPGRASGVRTLARRRRRYACHGRSGRAVAGSTRLPALMDLYIHPLYVLVNKILSCILNSFAPIHHLYHHLSPLSTVGSTCHFI
jgi:hypothetical protein